MENKRAVQFTPFAALRGYYDRIREKERVRVEHHTLADDSAEILSRKMACVRRGMEISVIHYSDGEYIKTCGLVSGIDVLGRKLTVVKTVIDFEDIYDLSGEGIGEDEMQA